MLHGLSATHLVTGFLHHFLTIDSILMFASFALSLLGALATFYIRTDHNLRKSLRNSMRFVFPWHVLKLPSAKLDCVFIVVHYITHALLLAPLLAGNVAAAVGLHHVLTLAFGERPLLPESVWMHAAVLAGALILTDFGFYCAHYIMHRFPSMWELHKVHHSALYLIPFSRRRLHPIEEIIDSAIVMLFVGAWLGITAYLFGLPIQDVGIAGVDAYFILNALSFYHLRHTHIPMGYGWLERWIVSPAQHHVHHSIKPAHLGKNLGTLLAVWDRMFGTWAPSEAYHTLPLGLMPEDQPQDYTSVPKLYWIPIRRIGERVVAGLRMRPMPQPSERTGL